MCKERWTIRGIHNGPKKLHDFATTGTKIPTLPGKLGHDSAGDGHHFYVGQLKAITCILLVV